MSARRGVLPDGLIVGLIGYASVAVFYSVIDLFASRGLLYSVDLLGKALLFGLRDSSVLQFPVVPDARAVFLYNALHLAAALVIGLVVVSLVKQAEENPSRRGIVLLVMVAGFFVTVAVVGFLTSPLRPLLPYWSIVVANVVAVILAGAYLLRRRSGLMHVFGIPSGAKRFNS